MTSCAIVWFMPALQLTLSAICSVYANTVRDFVLQFRLPLRHCLVYSFVVGQPHWLLLLSEHLDFCQCIRSEALDLLLKWLHLAACVFDLHKINAPIPKNLDEVCLLIRRLSTINKGFKRSCEIS